MYCSSIHDACLSTHDRESRLDGTDSYTGEQLGKQPMPPHSADDLDYRRLLSGFPVVNKTHETQ